MDFDIPKSFADGRFEVHRVLGEGGMGVVYDVLDRDRDMRVALKTLRHVDLETIYYFKEEFRSLHDLMHPNICSLMELIEDNGSWLLTMELIHGQTFLSYVAKTNRLQSSHSAVLKHHLRFRQLCTGKAIDPSPEWAQSSEVLFFDETRLRMSLAGLYKGLSALHSAGKVHRDIKPPNVLVTDEGRVVLLDFGLITESEIRRHTETGAIVGTVEYMSPEQARSQTVAPESDWYSVGVMLYQALTGTLPFKGPPLKILIEKQKTDPPNPRDEACDLPEDLATLCMALLSRDPNARPSSSEISRILQIDNCASIRTNLTDRKPDNRRLLFVGRHAEIHLLEATHERMLRGSFEAVVIEGVSGVGKSALVQHFVSNLSSDTSPFILRGRCYERETAPFKAFDGVIDSFVRYASNNSLEEGLRLDPIDAKLLVRLFPALKRANLFSHVSLPATVIENPKEFQIRAFDAFKAMLFLLSRLRPVIVVIDDLQWIDADSIQLLGHLTGGLEVPEIMVLLTARYVSEKGTSALDWDNIISKKHERIHLKALDADESIELARKVLEQENIASKVKAAQIAKEAAGHPLYIAELIQHIASGGEDWQSLRLDDVIWNRIGSLPRVTRRLLEIICVLGTPFPKENLQNLAFLKSEDFYNSIAQLTAGNLVRSEGPQKDHRVETYHDRVREAVLEHLESGKLTKIHLNIGLFLLTIYSDTNLQNNVFEVVQHLEAGRDLITKPSEKRLLAELYFQAGKRSHESAAYASSLAFFKKSIALFPEEGWQSHYRTMLNLYSDAAEAAYIEGDFPLTTDLVNTATSNAKSDLDRVPIWKTYVVSLVADGKPIEGIDETVKMIRLLGVKLPDRPGRFYVFWKTIWMRLKLLGKTKEHLVNLPHTTDPYTIAVRRLLGTIGGVANLYLPDLWTIITINLVELSLEFGIDQLSAVAFGSWAMVNCGALRKYEDGYKYGTISLSIMEQFDGNSQNAMSIHLFASFIQHWVDHIRETLPLLMTSHDLAKKSGDTFNLVYTGTHYCYHCFFAGEYLPDLAEKCIHYYTEITYKKQELAGVRNRILYQTVLSLLGSSEDPNRPLVTPYGDTENTASVLEKREKDDVNLFNHLQCKLMLHIYLGRYFDAYDAALKAEKCVAVGTYFDAALPFYDSLACLKLIGEVDARMQKSLLSRVGTSQKKYRKTANSSPLNHEHKYKLVEAERARARGKYKVSAALYDAAIEGARKNQFINDAALACELAAEHYFQIEDKEKALLYAQRALSHYEEWGANAKVEHVKAKFNLQKDCAPPK